MLRLRLGAVLEKERNHIRVGIVRRHTQRIFVVSMHICAVLEKERHQISVTLTRRLPQSCVVVSVTPRWRNFFVASPQPEGTRKPAPLLPAALRA